MQAMKNLIIQGIGIAGMIVFFLSFQCRNNRNLYRLQFISYLFYMTHLLLLGAYTGGYSYLVNIFRSACLGSQWQFGHRKITGVIICIMQIAVLVFTWSSWYSIIPIAANIAATIGGYTNDGRKIRIINMTLTSPLWIIYDILAGSWAGVLDEIICELSLLVSILHYKWENLREEKGEKV